MQIYKYQTEIKENYVQYNCMKLDEGYWIIKENAPRDYTIILDTYTIELPEFIEKYNNSEGNIKAGLNAKKIIEALNGKDYKYLYNKLDTTFRNNKYPAVNNLQTYIENNVFKDNRIEYIELIQEGEIYIYKARIKNVDRDSEEKSFNIIMKLGEGTDFIFSFNIE